YEEQRQVAIEPCRQRHRSPPRSAVSHRAAHRGYLRALSALAMVARLVGRLRMRVGMVALGRWDRQLRHPAQAVATDRGELVLGHIIERIVQATLDVAAAFG